MGMILGGEITSALTTFAGLGLALILEGDGAEHVRLGWTDAAEPRMVVTADGYDDEAVATAVYQNALSLADSESWPQINLDRKPWVNNKGKMTSAAMSPCIAPPNQKEEWEYLDDLRNNIIDRCSFGNESGVNLELLVGQRTGVVRRETQAPIWGRAVMIWRFAGVAGISFMRRLRLWRAL